MNAALQSLWPFSFRHARHDPHAPLLELREITLAYAAHTALESVSMQLARGERLAVVGPNGAGKSTLLKVMAGFLDPTRGSIRVYGGAPASHVCIAYLPQRTEVDWRFPVTVTDVVMMGRTASVGWFRRAGADDRRAVARCLEQVGLSALARRPIGELSGGQQQRMFIARALAQQAEIFLVDEPLAGLDQPSQNELFQLLEGLARNGTAVVMTLHDLGLAAEHFDRIALLNRRVIALGRPADVFTPDLLLEAFGATGRAVRGGSGVIMIQDHGCCGGSAS